MKHRKATPKILALMVAICMSLLGVPANAWADETPSQTGPNEIQDTYTTEDGVTYYKVTTDQFAKSDKNFYQDLLTTSYTVEGNDNTTEDFGSAAENWDVIAQKIWAKKTALSGGVLDQLKAVFVEHVFKGESDEQEMLVYNKGDLTSADSMKQAEDNIFKNISSDESNYSTFVSGWLSPMSELQKIGLFQKDEDESSGPVYYIPAYFVLADQPCVSAAYAVVFSDFKANPLIPQDVDGNYKTTTIENSTTHGFTNAHAIKNDTAFAVNGSQSYSNTQSASVSSEISGSSSYSYGTSITLGLEHEFAVVKAAFETEFNCSNEIEKGWANGKEHSTEHSDDSTASVDLEPYTGVLIKQVETTQEVLTEYNCPISISYRVRVLDYFVTSFGSAPKQHNCRVVADFTDNAQVDLNMRAIVNKQHTDTNDIKWTDFDNDADMTTAIQRMAHSVPMASTPAQFREKLNTVESSVIAASLYPLKTIQMTDQDDEVLLYVGDSMRVDNIGLEGLIEMGYPYYGFNADYGEWVLIDERGNELTDGAIATLTKNDVTGRLTLTAVGPGTVYLKYLIDEGDDPNNRYGTWDNPTTYATNASLKKTAIIEITVDGAAKEAEDAIAAIPDASSLTLADEPKVTGARSIYNALTDDQQSHVGKSYVSKLESAEARIAELKIEAAAQAQEAARLFEEQVAAIPDVKSMKLSDEYLVSSARAMYQALSDEARGLVSRSAVATLEAAEARIVQLKEEAEAAAQAAADSFMADYVNAIPDVANMTRDDEGKVHAARRAYDALSEEAKALVADEVVAKLEAAEIRILALSNWQGSGTAESPFMIAGESDWQELAEYVGAGYSTAGMCFKLANDISVGSMVGDSANRFCGSFDGDGHTLTFNYVASSEYCAPFCIVDGATFANLHVDGLITTSGKFAAGLVAVAYGEVKVTNCRCSIAIDSSVNGDGTHGGFIAISNANCEFDGCVFDGKLLGANTTHCGGLVGYSHNNCSFSNCMYDASEATIKQWLNPISRGTCTIGENCYFTNYLDLRLGKQTHTISIAEGYSIGYGEGKAYDVSGITAYGQGVKYKGTFYAGSEDVVALTLPQLVTGMHYTVSGGALESGGTAFTLTMPDDDVVISCAVDETAENKEAVEAAQSAVNQIYAATADLANMTEADSESVAQARASYEALSDDAKALVPQEVLDKLNEAEAIIGGFSSLKNAKVELSSSSFTYNGRVQKPSVKVTLGGQVLVEGADFTAAWSNGSSKNAGSYTVTVTGQGKYSGTAKASYKINKAANPLIVRGKTATIKLKNLKKKAQKVATAKAYAFTKAGQGKMTFKLTKVTKAKYKKFFKVNAATGKVSVKKKLKKGTYKLKVAVKAAGNANYEPSAEKMVTVKIRVK